MGESEKFKYEYWRYDKHFVLKPPLALKISLVVLCKDLILSLLLGATKFKLKGGDFADDAVSLVDPAFFISNLPAAALLFAVILRGPNSGPIVRHIWRNGKIFLHLSLWIYFLTFFLKNGANVFEYTLLHWGYLTAYTLILVYALRSNLLTDAFAEFPAKTT